MIANPQILDISASLFSLISTIYSIRSNSLTWPTSLVAICIGIILYVNKGLYGVTGLHAIYFVLALYGWFQWKYGGKKHTKLLISQLTPKLAFICGLVLLCSISIISVLLNFYTDSKVPVWDASTTSISLVADFLMCRRIIQCWHLWFVADALFAVMYFHESIPAHGIIYSFYVFLAVLGFLRWRKDAATQEKQTIAVEPVAV